MDKPTATANAAQKIEKQARQLAYDTRYKVKQSMKTTSGSKLDPAAVRRAYEAQLSKSSAPPAVKARAKKMLLGEDFVADIQERVTDNVANALYKVFVEGVQKEEEPIVLTYMEKLETAEHRKYKVRVTDKKTNNSYVRYATREKISELRANPNIASVEMTGYGEPGEDEKKGGKQTAAAKAGKGLDPVGQEDKDIDNDGDHDKTDKYLLNRRKVRGAAIEKKDGVSEEFLGEINDKEKSGKIKPMGPNESNKVVINPEVPGSGRNMSGRLQMAHYEAEGEMIADGYTKFLDMLQEKKMTKNQKAKEKNLKKKYDPSGMKASMKKQYGEKKGEEVYFATIRKQAVKEEKKDQESGCEDDPRAKYAEKEVIKNRLRSALGIKNPIVMSSGYEPDGNLISEREMDEPGERDDRPDVKAHNRAINYRSRPRPRRPRTEDDPRYGTPRDRSGNWKY